MGAKATSAQLRALCADAKARDDAIQSTNSGVRLPDGACKRQNRADAIAEASANLVAGYLVALLAQQLILPLFDIHIGMAAHLTIAAMFTILSLLCYSAVSFCFDCIARQRHERERLQRERLMQRFAGGMR